MKNPIFQGRPTSYRVLRGGSWFLSAWNLRVSYRGYYAPTLTLDNLGFRIFRTKEKL